MPWKEVLPMEEIMSFVFNIKAGEFSFASLCRRYQISRKTGYKWWKRFLEGGLEALYERSCQPHSCPHQSPGCWRQRVVRLRLRYPHWGPKKLWAKLAKKYAAKSLPAPSTLGRMLQGEGLVRWRRRRRKGPVQRRPGLTTAQRANQVWAVDFKGWFRTGNGQRCDPLTVSDLYSRYVLCCQGVAQESYEATRPIFQQLFRRYGVPERIRVDNGAPFGSTGAGGLSRLSVWWLRLGIVPEFIQPGQPQENGAHERMHRTLKAETTRPPAWTLGAQQKRFESWRRQFNQQRPHEALGQEVPQRRYKVSRRNYQQPEGDLAYEASYAVRRVRANGEIRWQGRLRFIGQAFCGQLVGLKPVGAGREQVYFGDWLLGDLHQDHPGGLYPTVRLSSKGKGKLWLKGEAKALADGKGGRACSRGRGESVTPWRPAATRAKTRELVAAAHPPPRTARRVAILGKK